VDDVAANSRSGSGHFAFSAGPSGTGTLVYLAGKSIQGWSVSWLDTSGKTQPVLSATRLYQNPAISPDGRRLAVEAGTTGLDIFVYDFARQTMTRVSFDGQAGRPVWTPDGTHIVFRSASGVWWVRADGAGQPQLLLRTQTLVVPWSFSPDGRRLAYWEVSPTTSYDISILPLDTTDPNHPKPGKPQPFLHSPANEYVPSFSPDGRWIGYASDESGSYEIYVRPASGASGKWQISNAGGEFPLWSRSGHELFYEAMDHRIMTLDYSTNGDSFIPGKPRVWSDHQIFASGRSNLDIAPDGKRFVVFEEPQAPEPGKNSLHVVLLLNFLDELKRRIP